MNKLTQFVLAAATVGTCVAASAQTYSSDSDRRQRNREEAIANWEHNGRTADRPMSARRESVREETHEKADSARAKTHHAAQKTRSFTHRQLDKVRNFGDRQAAKLPNRPAQAEINKTPQAMGK
jgi:hypothetical protein